MDMYGAFLEKNKLAFLLPFFQTKSILDYSIGAMNINHKDVGKTAVLQNLLNSIKNVLFKIFQSFLKVK